MKSIRVLTGILLAGVLLGITACPVADENTELPWTYPPGVTDKLDYTNGDKVKIALAITGDQDPGLALKYRMGSSTGPYYFDYVVLCAAKMVKEPSGASFTFNLDLGEVQQILDNRTALLAPLQAKGIKVLLQIVNGGDGFSFANLPYTLRQPFAKTVRDILVRNNLDGLEFVDINGGSGVYPALGEEHYYDPAFDDRPAYNPDHIGDTIAIGHVDILNSSDEIIPLSDEQKVDYFWHQGGYNYGAFLTYFRPLVESPNTPTTAVIGDWHDKPIWVREVGFGAGDSRNPLNPNLFGTQRSYIAAWIKDDNREELQFTAVSDMANVFISSNVNGTPFGWEGTGKSIMEFADHLRYSPGILDLSSATETQIEAFSERFADGNMVNPDDFIFHGDPYALLYYTNVGLNDAAKLSISSRYVYGGRQENGVFLVGLLKNGPEVVYSGN